MADLTERTTGQAAASGAAMPGTVLITGASSGIGAALARHYGREGRALLLWGRDATRLAAVASDCAGAGARAVGTRAVDLAEPEAAVAQCRADDAGVPVELAILCAGLGDMKRADRATEDPGQVIRVGTVNFVATSALATAFAERMAARRRGTIVLIGSVAAFHPLPMAATYAGSKAGLAHFAEALSIGMAPHGVSVLLVSPGFVDTPMSRRVGSAQPFLLDVDAAARRIARAIRRRERHLILPWPFRLLRAGTRLMPPGLHRLILGRLRAAAR